MTQDEINRQLQGQGVLKQPPTGSGSPSGGAHVGAPLGLYFVGAIGVLALADTRVAPVMAALLVAAAIYNANYLLKKYQTK